MQCYNLSLAALVTGVDVRSLQDSDLDTCGMPVSVMLLFQSGQYSGRVYVQLDPQRCQVVTLQEDGKLYRYHTKDGWWHLNYLTSCTEELNHGKVHSQCVTSQKCFIDTL